jgi:N6-L-threonylcarbamoyladenine synthase
VPVNHMEGHILSILVPKGGKEFQLTKDSFAFPAISLLVSGGHTEIVLVKSIGKYKILGATLDDAAGEAFDKVARMMGLPYPGGPEISRLAAMARKNKLVQTIKLPRPMLHTKDLNFSFSGLKTSVLYLIRDMGGIETLSDETKMNIAREFEDATCDVLVHKTLAAAKANKAKSIIVGGGVSANKELNERLTRAASAIGISVTFPTKDLSTDNAIMIGLAGYFGKKVSIKSKKLIAVGNMVL